MNLFVSLFDSTTLITFVLAALVVLVIPGPGVLYVVTRSLVQGHRAGLISVIGLSFGVLFHVVAATLGLSAILFASATAFGVVKLLGALYLIYLGVRTLVVKQSVSTISTPEPDSHFRIFVDGVIVSVFNPKVAVFFLAFLPQFISPEQGSISHQFMLLGLVYVVLAMCTDGAYVFLASSLRHLLTQRLIQGPVLRLTGGFVYLGMGVSLALADRRA